MTDDFFFFKGFQPMTFLSHEPSTFPVALANQRHKKKVINDRQKIKKLQHAYIRILVTQ